jgi:hypothetical protein
MGFHGTGFKFTLYLFGFPFALFLFPGKTFLRKQPAEFLQGHYIDLIPFPSGLAITETANPFALDSISQIICHIRHN